MLMIMVGQRPRFPNVCLSPTVGPILASATWIEIGLALYAQIKLQDASQAAF